MDTDFASELTLVVPATGRPDELLRTLKSIGGTDGNPPCRVVVPYPAADLATPATVAGCLNDATCLAVGGAGDWGTLANAGATYAKSERVGWVISGMMLAEGWLERLEDRVLGMPGADHVVGEWQLWGSVMEVTCSVREGLPEAVWPTTSDEAARDSWQLVHELSRSLREADREQPQEAPAEAPSHAVGFDENMDGVGARVATVMRARQDDPTLDRVRWEDLGIERGLTSIVILTRNQLDYTRGCVESIARHTPEDHELIFVDNGSDDGTIEYLEGIDGAVVIRNGHNRGFGAGCNQGIAVARGDRILLLNNDTVVTEGWLGRMLAAMEDEPSRAVVGPRSNYVAGPQQVPPVAYDEKSLDGLDEFAVDWAIQHEGRGRELDRVIGFCMLLHRQAVDRIGGFDLRFGIGNLEDDDICLRARVAGFAAWMADDSYVHHYGNRTFIGEGIDYRATMVHNWTEFLRKWRFPDGSVDWSTRAYSAAAIIASREFDPAEHWTAPWIEPQQALEVGFGARSMSVLVAPDWATRAELDDVLTKAMTAWGPTDDVTLVVRAGPGDEHVIDALESAADAVGDAHLPDIVVVPAGSDGTEAVLRQCSNVLCFGRATATLHQMGRRLGTRPITIDELGNATGESEWRAA